ncbi:MAG: type II secretion system F family protein [Magnetococcales bacterium]|nr:type II secretion system F family protein [Magnetococcales bacterium]
MARFQYVGRAAGERVAGEMDGINPEYIAAQLQNQGIVPLTIAEIKQNSRVDWSWLPGINKVSVDDLIVFSRQMAALTRSGVPLVRAFTGLIDSTVNSTLKNVMKQIVADLEAGHELSVALGEHPRIFDKFFVKVVRVGEEMGKLEDAFTQIFHYLESGKITRQRITNAVRYPIFVVLTVIVAMGVVNYYVIPAFIHLFAKFGSQLPITTQILVASSNFTRNYAPLLLAILVALIIVGRSVWQRPKGRLFYDRAVLKIPIVGPLLHRIILARLSRIFVLGSRSGMNMVQILSAVESTVNNRFLAQRVADIRLGVSRGESLVKAAQRSQIFTPLVLQMLAVGDETGQFEHMMDEVAEFYEQEVDYEIKGLSSTIEPILLLFLAVLVLVLAMGIFLPLWNLGSGGLAN